MCCTAVPHEHVSLRGGLPLVLRHATADDADGIAHVYLEAAKGQYGRIVPAETLRALRLGDLSERWRAMLATRSPVRTAFVATVAGVIVGFAAGGLNRVAALPFDGEIFAIYVKPSEQRRGIGRHLLMSVLGSLRDQGLRSVMLWVFAHNGARGFFKAAGAKCIGTSSPRAAALKAAYAWLDVGSILDSSNAGPHH